MGFSISWIGFNGLGPSEALERLGMAPTKARDEANEAPFSFAELPNRWLILFANDFDYVDDALLARLSDGCTVIGCQIHEGVMYAGATLYDQGREIWSVAHEGSGDVYDLTVSGTPPDGFEALRARCVAQQKADDPKASDSVDYIFEIPVELARLACGYRYDLAQFEWGEPVFRVVKPKGGGKARRQIGFLQRLFSGQG